MRRILAAGTLALVSALLLSGCIAPQPTPDPQPTRSPRPTATADAAPPTAASASAAPAVETPAVATVVIRPLGLDLLDPAGALIGVVSYDDDASHIARTLVAAFGEPAVVNEIPASCCAFPRITEYSWVGFDVYDDHQGRFDDADPTVWIDTGDRDARDMNVHVIATADHVNDVTVTTERGFSVGDDASDLRLANEMWAENRRFAEYEVETGPDRGEPYFPGERNAYSVVLMTGGEDTPAKIFAPLNLGADRD